jgi:hypothetical protein
MRISNLNDSPRPQHTHPSSRLTIFTSEVACNGKSARNCTVRQPQWDPGSSVILISPKHLDVFDYLIITHDNLLLPKGHHNTKLSTCGLHFLPPDDVELDIAGNLPRNTTGFRTQTRLLLHRVGPIGSCTHGGPSFLYISEGSDMWFDKTALPHAWSNHQTRVGLPGFNLCIVPLAILHNVAQLMRNVLRLLLFVLVNPLVH